MMPSLLSSFSRSSLIGLHVVGLLGAWVSAVEDVVGSTYSLTTVYEGVDFFDNFDFLTTADPTHGFVNYVSQEEATTLGLITTSSANGAYMGVDYTSTLTSTGVGRNSVRITSKESFTHGLIISDISHMPGPVCGTWPAHWTLGPDWPSSGEIDIIEGVNSQTENLMSMHTNGTCTIAGDMRYQSGITQANDCDYNTGGSSGCSTLSQETDTYGAGFNNIGGGVFATQWTSDYIRIWFFPRNSIPTDILDQSPDPSLWGTPQANFQGDCDIDANFKEHQIIFDTTFCGDWGGNVWATDSTCKALAPTCVDYVAGFPGAFETAYWAVNSIKVYQLEDLSSSPSSSATPSSTSAATTSSGPAALTSSSSESASSTETVAHFSNTNSPEPTSLTSVTPASSVLIPGMGASNTTSSTPTSTLVFPSQTATTGPDTYIIDSFFYLGCVGSTSGFSTFTQVSESRNMTPALCVSSCDNYVYAGIYSEQCFCADTLDAGTGVGNGVCDAPCPGDATQHCGGISGNNTLSSNSTLSRRQTTNILLTTYENAAPVVPISSSSSSPTPTSAPSSTSAYIDPSIPRITISIAPGPNYTGALPAIISGIVSAALAAATDGGAYYVPSGSSTAPVSLTTAVPASQVLGIGMGGSPQITTEVVTTYVDVCPTGLTTITTTSTIAHCSCLDHLSGTVTIPMTTTVKVCPVCGPSGKPATYTVTIPATASAFATASRGVFYATPVTKSTGPGSGAASTPAYLIPVNGTAIYYSNGNKTILSATKSRSTPTPIIIYSTATVVPVENTASPVPLFVSVSVPVPSAANNISTTVPITIATANAGERLEALELGLVISFTFMLVGGMMLV